jgi:UDP-N-acetylmuramoyl-tripeptide--D-alanyl-D-alanine ligase
VSLAWTAADARTATGGRLLGRQDWQAEGVSIDSRSVKPGEIFVALQGPSFDGHDFVAAALAKGAAAALVHRPPLGTAADAPLLMVADTLAGLIGLGIAGRARSRARALGVTGSVGKTGTKEALRLALSTQSETYANEGSLNNHWGVPLSLARLPSDVPLGVFELGMNHAGELGPLSRMVQPDVAVITTIEPAHLEFFDSIEAIADAKAEIFEGMTSEGAAVLNQDNGQFERLAAHARRHGITRILGFGEHPAAAIRLLDCRLDAMSSEVSAEVLGRHIDYKLGAPGRHWVQNSLAVLGAVAALELDTGLAAAALSALTPPKGRGQRRQISLPGGAIELIDESYNASPAAMRAAFAVLAKAMPGPRGRRIAVLGDMRELGETARGLHADLAPAVVEAGIDLVLTCGPLMKSLHDALPRARRGAHAADSQALVPAVLAAARPGDVILVKGSLGTRMAPIIEALLQLDSAADRTGPRARAANGH